MYNKEEELLKLIIDTYSNMVHLKDNIHKFRSLEDESINKGILKTKKTIAKIVSYLNLRDKECRDVVVKLCGGEKYRSKIDELLEFTTVKS